MNCNVKTAVEAAVEIKSTAQAQAWILDLTGYKSDEVLQIGMDLKDREDIRNDVLEDLDAVCHAIRDIPFPEPDRCSALDAAIDIRYQLHNWVYDDDEWVILTIAALSWYRNFIR